MSIVGGIYPDPDKAVKKSSNHRRYDSSELDVFEAARYFSGMNENLSYSKDGNSSMPTQKLVMREDDDRRQLGGLSAGRISVDMPMTMRHALLASHHHHHQQQQHQMSDSNKQRSKEKKQKQPSSPGGKLASFLNSLFTGRHQTLRVSEKKKSSSSSTKSSSSSSAAAQMVKDEEESPGGTGRWRRRRSSISHFRSTSSNTTTSTAAGILEYSKSMLLSSSSSGGFRTPPPYVSTSSYKDFRSNINYSDHKQLLSANLTKHNTSTTKTSTSSTTSGHDTGMSRNNFDWLDEKLMKFTSNSNNGLSSTKSKNNSNHDSTKARSSSCSRMDHRYRAAAAAAEDDQEKKEIIKRFNEVDDEDSDSSSDLFELQLNYDHLGYCSSGLPVYETTHMDSIKRSSSATPITNGPVKS